MAGNCNFHMLIFPDYPPSQRWSPGVVTRCSCFLRLCQSVYEGSLSLVGKFGHICIQLPYHHLIALLQILPKWRALISHKADSHSLAPTCASSSYLAHIVLTLCRHVVIDHQGDLRSTSPAVQDISRHARTPECILIQSHG